MPRQQRLNIPGSIFHVIARGIERRNIFSDEEDREDFLKRLGQALEKTHHQCHAWALMPNHFHLLIRSSEQPLGELMRRLMTGYAGYFNRRQKRSGHLFQNRYKSILCQEDTYFLELVRYIHLNPVRARLVDRMVELDRYPWTGHSVLMTNQKRHWQNTQGVLSLFSSKIGLSRNSYQQFIAEGWNMGPRQDIMGGGLRRSTGGWKGIEALKRADTAWQGDARILGDGDFVSNILKTAEETLVKAEQLKRAGWTLDKVIQHACDITCIQPEELHQKGRNNAISKAKGLIAYWGVKELGTSGRVLSRYLLISPQAVSRCVEKGKLIAKLESIKLIN